MKWAEVYKREYKQYRTEVPLLIYAMGFTKCFRMNKAFSSWVKWANFVQVFKYKGELYVQFNEQQRPLQNKLQWVGNTCSFTYGGVDITERVNDYTVLVMVAETIGKNGRMACYRLESTTIRQEYQDNTQIIHN